MTWALGGHGLPPGLRCPPRSPLHQVCRWKAVEFSIAQQVDARVSHVGNIQWSAMTQTQAQVAPCFLFGVDLSDRQGFLAGLDDRRSQGLYRLGAVTGAMLWLMLSTTSSEATSPAGARRCIERMANTTAAALRFLTRRRTPQSCPRCSSTHPRVVRATRRMWDRSAGSCGGLLRWLSTGSSVGSSVGSSAGFPRRRPVFASGWAAQREAEAHPAM